MIESEILRHAKLLAAADGQRTAQALPAVDILTLEGSDGYLALQDVLRTPRDPVRVALDRVSDNTLVYIMALMLYGRAEGSCGPGAAFDDALREAKQHFIASGRARTSQYVQAKPLSQYLPAGLARLNRPNPPPTPGV